jgi:hypothetical protein
MSGKNPSKGKLELIAARNFKANEELYKVVDFLNKNLKHKDLMFGLARDNSKDAKDTMVITIYEV